MSDLTSVGVWREALDLEDAGLYSQVPQLLELVLCANAPNTVSKYSSGWSRWHTWAMSKVGVPHLPAEPLHVALYILELTNSQAKPIQPKEPISEITLLQLAEHYNKPCTLN